MKPKSKIEQLLRKGVRIPNPQSIDIGDDVSIDRISGKDVTIYSGSKIYGPETFIADGAEVGYEGPVTIENCYLGPDVALKGGYFQEAVFLEGAQCGLGSHIRKGTILEEQASIAHTVGLKQTILFPFVTLGSLINFCDCLMAGGTSRKNHSEVGSAYIHFNYTPNQDKATPSIMGDVPRGVMLNQSPIFLGGQGGMVGPCRLAYGTVVAAGTICRKDQLKEDYLVMESGPPTARLPLKRNAYRNIKQIVNKNVAYIANLYALRQWYTHIRARYAGERFPPALLQGLLSTVQTAIDERIKQLGRLPEKVGYQATAPETVAGRISANWNRIRQKLDVALTFEGRLADKDAFVDIIAGKIASEGSNYIQTILQLDEGQSDTGIRWLQSIVDHIENDIKPLVEIN